MSVNSLLASPEDEVSTVPEIVSPNGTYSLYQEAIAERQTDVSQEAKTLIKARIKEIEHLRTLLCRAEAALAALLQKTPEEIAMLSDFRGVTSITASDIVKARISHPFG